MPLPELTELGATHGFTAGDLVTSGLVAMQPAWQKVYFADGRPSSSNGYHKLDFISTKLTGTNINGAFTKGEVVSQATSLAKGIFIETADTKLTIGAGITGTFTKGENVTQAISLARGIVVAAATGAGPLYVYVTYGTFVASQIITGSSSAATGTVTVVGPGDCHLIYRTTTTEFDATNVVTGATSGKTFTSSATPVVPPHWLPWGLTLGDFPDGGSNIMALCFGRIFMNSMFNPNQWYATRVGDPLDLLLSQDDVGTPVASQTSEAGYVGDAITALVSYKGHYLVFGCANQIWVLTADPAANAMLRQVATPTGIFSNTAWCWDDKDNLYFVGVDGIYVMTGDAITNIQPAVNLTKDLCPKLIKDLGLNRRTDRVTLAYDKDRYGIICSVVQMDGQWSTSFWIDLRTGGVFPEVYNVNNFITSAMFFDSRKKEERGFLIGCQDGYIRKYDETIFSDDGIYAITSWDVIGPIVSAPDKRFGSEPYDSVKIEHLSIIAGDNTSNLEVGLYSEDNAEKLVKNILDGDSPQISRTFTENGLLPSMRQKIEGGALAIKLGNSALDKTWSIEKITTDSVKIKNKGRR